MCPVRSVTYVSGRSFIGLLRRDILRLRQLWGLFEGPHGNFHFSEHVGCGTQRLVPDMSVALRHPNQTPHNAPYDWIRNSGFQQTGDRGVPEIMESTLQRLRLFTFCFGEQNRAGSFFGFLPSFLPIAGPARFLWHPLRPLHPWLGAD
jgi:hypothetical protein